MAEFDVDYFISIVQEHPVIWDVNNSDYKNKFIKHDAWKSVCESLFPNFQERENSERTELGNEVIKRWKGVKDSFNKYEKKLKDANRTGTGSKIKEYHLYKQLQFLKANFPNENTATETDIEQTVQPIPEKPEKIPRQYKKIPKRKIATEYEDEVVKLLKEPSNKHISFYKGILPSVERLDENNTLLFQSRVLQVLTELLQCQPFDYGYPNSNYQNSYQTQHLETPDRRRKPHSSNGTEHSSSCSSYQVPSPVHNLERGRKNDRTDMLPEVEDIIANVYSYLYTEYHNLKLSSETVNLSPLANILKRTASATGVSEYTVRTILEERKRSADDERDAGAAKRAKFTHDAGDVSMTDEESNCGVDVEHRRDIERADIDCYRSSDSLDQQTNEAASAVHHLLSNIEVKIEPPEVKIEPADDGDPRSSAGVLFTTSNSLVRIKTEPIEETAHL